jgi:hypothetical protein
LVEDWRPNCAPRGLSRMTKGLAMLAYDKVRCVNYLLNLLISDFHLVMIVFLQFSFLFVCLFVCLSVFGLYSICFVLCILCWLIEGILWLLLWPFPREISCLYSTDAANVFSMSGTTLILVCVRYFSLLIRFVRRRCLPQVLWHVALRQ